MCESTDKVIETTTTNQDCFTTSNNNNNNSSSSTTTTSSNRTCFSFNIKTTTQKIDRQSPHRRYALKCILYPFRNDQRSISNTNHCSSSSSLSSSVSYLISSILKIIFAIGIGSIIIMVTSYTLFQSNQPIGLYYRTIISSSKLFIHTSTTMTATHLRNFIQNNHHHNNNNIPSFRDFKFSKYFLSSFFERSTTTSNADTTAAESWTTSCTTVTKEKCNISQQRSNDDNSSILYINDVDYNLLLNITYQVGNFYPLPPKEETTSTKTNDNNKKRYDTNIIMNQRIMMKPKRFIPVLEARGSDGRDIDKDEFGHRRDTMPIANAIDQYIIHNNGNNEGDHDVQSAIFQFLEEDNGSNQYAIQSNIALKKYLKEVAHGIIVRNNPGTLSPLSQKSFDDMLRQLSEDGVIILSHPDVMSTLGAKDVSFIF